MSTLPFIIRGVITSLVDLNGIARLEENELCLEFQTVHPLSKFIKSEAKAVHVPLSELEDVRFRSFFCLGFLILRARNMTVFSSVPGAIGSELRLRCRREHFAIAREFASRLNMGTVTQELKDLIGATNIQTRPAISPAENKPEHTAPAPKRGTPTVGEH